jgi:hypothetical protein
MVRFGLTIPLTKVVGIAVRFAKTRFIRSFHYQPCAHRFFNPLQVIDRV